MASAAQATTHEFYKGKTIRIIVSAAAGGGFDTYSRTIARQMGKHIPGNPSLIVANMTGAGGLIAANHVYKVAKPDGLTIGNFAYPCLYLAARDRQRTGTAAASGLHASAWKTCSGRCRWGYPASSASWSTRSCHSAKPPLPTASWR